MHIHPCLSSLLSRGWQQLSRNLIAVLHFILTEKESGYGSEETECEGGELRGNGVRWTEGKESLTLLRNFGERDYPAGNQCLTAQRRKSKRTVRNRVYAWLCLCVMVNLITNSCWLSHLSSLYFFLFDLFRRTFCPLPVKLQERIGEGMRYDKETLSSN